MLVGTSTENYEDISRSFRWEQERKGLSGLPGNQGLNIAYECVTRHAISERKDHVALKWIRKDGSHNDFTYSDLDKISSRFANVLVSLGIKREERVCSLLGRVPELYITALGTLKNVSVFCPLFSVFGPEPVFQRLSRGDVAVVVTTMTQYKKKDKAIDGSSSIVAVCDNYGRN